MTNFIAKQIDELIDVFIREGYGEEKAAAVYADLPMITGSYFAAKLYQKSGIKIDGLNY